MPTISKDIWITREGHQIEIRSMASSHLLSTIHFIERNRLTQATDCAMREPDLENDALQYYLQWPLQYDDLIAEAQRRGLMQRQVQGIVKKGKK